MKINFIIPFTGCTGGIKVIYEYANRLYERGHDVAIYVPMLGYNFGGSGLKGINSRIRGTIGNTFIRGKTVDWFDLKVDINLVPKINNIFLRNADIVIATAWPTAYDVALLNENKGEKVYFIQHYETWSGSEYLVDGSYKLDLNQIVIAKWLKSLMKDKFNKNSELIYSGINDSDFNYGDKNISNDITISIMYHELIWKGFNDGMAAIENIRDKYPNIKLNIFGMKKMTSIPEYATFYHNPSREKLKQIYNESHIFLFPSRKEGWGLTVIEAMACKCAVIGTDTGALEDIGIHEINCLKSSPNDIDALTENLDRIINDINLMNLISENGFETALNFKWDKSIDKLEEYFNNLKNKRRG